MGSKEKKAKKRSREGKEEHKTPNKQGLDFEEARNSLPPSDEKIEYMSPKKKQKLGFIVDSPKKKLNFFSEKTEEEVIKESKNKYKEDSEKESDAGHYSSENIASDKEAKKSEVNGWPLQDVETLLERISAVSTTFIKKTKCQTAINKVKWDKVMFKDYSKEDCHNMWVYIDSNQRKYRTFSEILEDASTWIKDPSVNQNRKKKVSYPGLPKHPLTSYFLFLKDKKEKVQQKHPEMKVTEITKLMAQMFKSLSDKKKRKYEAQAAELREKYNEELQKFYEIHPEAKPPSLSKSQNKLKKPFQLYLEDKMSDVVNDPSFDKNAFTEKYKEKWMKLPDNKKLKWIVAAYDAESKYKKELQEQNPENGVQPSLPKTSIIPKAELAIYHRSRGKPDKLPPTAYSLFFSQQMISSEFEGLAKSEKMARISSLWNNLSNTAKNNYKLQLLQLQDQYETDLAAYLKTLSPEERDKELEELNKVKKRPVKVPPRSTQRSIDSMIVSASSKKPTSECLLFGEPSPPPQTEFDFFMQNTRKRNCKISKNQIQEIYNRFSPQEHAALKEKFRKVQKEYYNAYELFLSNLDATELKLYMQKKTQANAALFAEREQNSDCTLSQKVANKNEIYEDGEDSEIEVQSPKNVKITSPIKIQQSIGVNSKIEPSDSSEEEEEDDDDDDDEEDNEDDDDEDQDDQKITTISTQVVKKLEETSDSESDSSDSG